jgi:streptogramin lyase
MKEPFGIAIDSSGSVWVTNYASGGGVTKLSNSGSVLSGATGYSGGGLNYPVDIAIDGAGSVWVANQFGNSVTAISNSGSSLSGANGYLGGGLNAPAGVAIDGSGNAWVTSLYNSSVAEFVGAATPVVTPIVEGLPSTPTSNGTSSLGTRP